MKIAGTMGFFLLLLMTAPWGSGVNSASWPFADVTGRARIDFRHHSGITPQRYMYETFGSGCGFIDYDGDGFLDIYLVNGADRVNGASQLSFRNPGNALYRNRGNATFEDVTAVAGVAGHAAYGMGVAVGDYDNDGHDDLYVTYLGGDILYHNNGNGTFTDVTAKTGLAGPDSGWSASAAFFDYDNDGWLDLYVCKYVRLGKPLDGCQFMGQAVYCHPDDFDAISGKLYRNLGKGRFKDVTAESAIGALGGKGLGVVAVDYNNDGWMDLFVANDLVRNFLWKNNGNGTFTEVSLLAATGFNEQGVPESGMGVDAGDYDGDRLPDLVVTHFEWETTALYRNEGNGFFTDTRWPAKVATPGLGLVSWGTGFFDYDNDGDEDLFIVSGHLLDNIHLLRDNITAGQKSQLFVNAGGVFREILDSPDSKVSRGAAFGDFDNDGRVDVLVSNNNQEPVLYRNVNEEKNHWITLRLIGSRSNRNGVGSKVTLVTGGKRQVKQLKGGGSYLSANDLRIHFGLDRSSVADRITIQWPSGIVDVLKHVGADQIIKVQEGRGVSRAG